MSDTSSMFYGWQQWEKTGDPRFHLAKDNPPFATGQYSQPPGGRKLLKGYLRSALPEQNGNTRFHFQYNPNLITRSTTVNQDLLGLAQQTAADMQSMSMAGAGAGFSFSLILDRQDEVASGHFINNTGGTAPQLGVDVDIRALDAVAGIGQYSAAIDSTAESNTGNGYRTGFENRNSEREAAAQVAGDGNQAFMASMLPLRVVFSKNFIVEGFLNNIDVTYTKFSRNMVPVMATVQCAMQAFYIGTARATTWWSESVANGDLATAKAKAGAGGSMTDLFGFGGGGGGGAGSPSSTQAYGNNARPNTVTNSGVVVNATTRLE